MYKSALLSLQVNCVFLAITLKVLLSRKLSMNDNGTSNKRTVKYVNICSLLHVLIYDCTYVHIRSLLKALIILMPLLGVTWIIGILAVNEDTQVFAWIFAILNSLQVT